MVSEVCPIHILRTFLGCMLNIFNTPHLLIYNTGTIRSNILMGASYDPKYYYECCEACGLFRDFSQFIHGDKTIVGDKGVQCSGGQKARYVCDEHAMNPLLYKTALTSIFRIALARALYLDADILLLDDPLSAVDTKVGRHIFHSAVHNMAVKRGKCVVLGEDRLTSIQCYFCRIYLLGYSQKHI